MVRWAEQRIRAADIDDALFGYSAGKLGADVLAKGTLGALFQVSHLPLPCDDPRMRIEPQIEFNREALEALCRMHDIRRLALFGSPSVGDSGPRATSISLSSSKSVAPVG